MSSSIRDCGVNRLCVSPPPNRECGVHRLCRRVPRATKHVFNSSKIANDESKKRKRILEELDLDLSNEATIESFVLSNDKFIASLEEALDRQTMLHTQLLGKEAMIKVNIHKFGSQLSRQLDRIRLLTKSITNICKINEKLEKSLLINKPDKDDTSKMSMFKANVREIRAAQSRFISNV